MNALVQSSRKKHAEAAVNSTPDIHQYLTFLSGSEVFAIGILSIKEIIEYGGLTVVPMMPHFVRGVINLRGAVVPVIDLLARFGKPASEVTKRTCIVIVEIEADNEQQVIGVMVDAVHAVVDIAATEIAPAPAFGARIRPEFIEGMGKINDRFIILINVNKVLSIDEIGAIADASIHPAAPVIVERIESTA
ncbi:MAG: chemotaxis protein CheW [Burkholderiaceae bacterium]